MMSVFYVAFLQRHANRFAANNDTFDFASFASVNWRCKFDNVRLPEGCYDTKHPNRTRRRN